MELETSKLRLAPYLEKQFTIYSELWSSLIDLKNASDNLFIPSDEEAYLKFRNKLDNSLQSIEKSALLINESLYNEIISILNNFDRMEIDKRTLKDITNLRECGYPDDGNMIRSKYDEIVATRSKLMQSMINARKFMRDQLINKYVEF